MTIYCITLPELYLKAIQKLTEDKLFESRSSFVRIAISDFLNDELPFLEKIQSFLKLKFRIIAPQIEPKLKKNNRRKIYTSLEKTIHTSKNEWLKIVSVNLPSNYMIKLNQLCAGKVYPSRLEAIRVAVREKLKTILNIERVSLKTISDIKRSEEELIMIPQTNKTVRILRRMEY